MTRVEVFAQYQQDRAGKKTYLAGMMKEENSGNDNKVGAKRKALLAGMANEEYSSSADKTEPEIKSFIASRHPKVFQSLTRRFAFHRHLAGMAKEEASGNTNTAEPESDDFVIVAPKDSYA